MADPTYYFYYPFCGGPEGSGNKSTIPTLNPGDGTVSYDTGYGNDYSLAPSNPSSKNVPREAYNQAMYDVTQWAQQMQEWGTPNFITASQNPNSETGVAFPYAQYARVLYNNQIYISLINNNNSVPPGPNWALVTQTESQITIQNPNFAVGVTEGMAVYFDGTYFQPALANGALQNNVIGIADTVNNLVIVQGICNVYSGLTSGIAYYLSTTTAGGITTIISPPNVYQIGVALNSTSLVLTKQNLSSVATARIPGEMAFFANNSAGTPYVPNGWLWCTGQSVSRTAYAALFAAIGTTFGSIDSASFNVPNTLDYFPRPWNPGGITTGFGVKVADTFQQHIHSISAIGDLGTPPAGVVAGLASTGFNTGGAISGNPGSETAPKYIGFLHCIKY